MTENNSRETAIDVEFEQVNQNSESSRNVPPDDSSTATAALVLGIAGVVSAFTGKFALIGLICSIIGLVLSSGQRACNPSGIVTAAFVLSIIGTAAAAAGLLVFILALAGGIALMGFF